MTQVRINAAIFAAAEKFSLKGDIVVFRPYLSGVFFKQHPEGGVIAMASDGICAAMVYDPKGIVDQDNIIVLPKKAVKLASMKKNSGAQLCIDGCTGHFENARVGKGVDDSFDAEIVENYYFPDITQMVPTGECGYVEKAEFAINPKILKKFVKASDILQGGAVNIHHMSDNVEDPLIVTFSDNPNFYGFAAQVCNVGDKNIERPDWICSL